MKAPPGWGGQCSKWGRGGVPKMRGGPKWGGFHLRPLPPIRPTAPSPPTVLYSHTIQRGGGVPTLGWGEGGVTHWNLGGGLPNSREGLKAPHPPPKASAPNQTHSIASTHSPLFPYNSKGGGGDPILGGVSKFDGGSQSPPSSPPKPLVPSQTHSSTSTHNPLFPYNSKGGPHIKGGGGSHSGIWGGVSQIRGRVLKPPVLPPKASGPQSDPQ